MWLSKKKIVQPKPRQFEFVKTEVKKLKFKMYEAKIYNESMSLIGETYFNDTAVLRSQFGYSSATEEFPVEASTYCHELDEFRHFNDFGSKTLVFTDLDDNIVSLSKDIIKKITIAEFDAFEEEFQLYKYVEVTDETPNQET